MRREQQSSRRRPGCRCPCSPARGLPGDLCTAPVGSASLPWTLCIFMAHSSAASLPPPSGNSSLYVSFLQSTGRECKLQGRRVIRTLLDSVLAGTPPSAVRALRRAEGSRPDEKLTHLGDMRGRGSTHGSLPPPLPDVVWNVAGLQSNLPWWQLPSPSSRGGDSLSHPICSERQFCFPLHPPDSSGFLEEDQP